MTVGYAKLGTMLLIDMIHFAIPEILLAERFQSGHGLPRLTPWLVHSVVAFQMPDNWCEP